MSNIHSAVEILMPQKWVNISEQDLFSYSFSESYEQKRQQLTSELQKKEEEMKQMFVVRVKEKESELKDAEKAVSYSE